MIFVRKNISYLIFLQSDKYKNIFEIKSTIFSLFCKKYLVFYFCKK